ncbi:MAG: glutathione synthase [Betaproteobacteria bacterium]|nr:glutathione synthase [Betaproteobacteria bacterium]MDE2122796.1 glutathione synthase [Betaproteobacteria bacterium]MDE2185736.1 glutathione synthase [Betaproteobacteria bacterium]MDE2325520.1 glutathione synthase [Betaproteobacteria bacterium]
MNLLFVADPLEDFNPKKDSTLAMMREAQRRGDAVWACEPRHLRWSGGGATHAGPVRARCRHIQVLDAAGPWFIEVEQLDRALHAFDAVLMRKDPPFDSEFFYATHLLEQAEREGAHVYNAPRALRDHPEKLSILEWPQFIPATLVSRDMAQLRAFAAEHGDIIVKPLDGMGGAGIFRLRTGAGGSPDVNLGVVLETLTDWGRRSIMAQRFLPEIAQGDKRVLIIGGAPVPFALARIPQHGETRGNLAAGGKGVAQPLTASDRAIAEALGPTLAARGLLLVGIDIIGERLTEINVTSPTCFVEITQQTGFDVAACFLDALSA